MIRHIRKHAKKIEQKIDTIDVEEQGNLVSTLIVLIALGFIMYRVLFV
ncbi:MAG: hypothetical protein WCL23_03540 [Candidatus Moraniibacteriota bacterium]